MSLAYLLYSVSLIKNISSTAYTSKNSLKTCNNLILNNNYTVIICKFDFQLLQLVHGKV